MFIALATVALTLVIGGRALLHLTGMLPVEGLGPMKLASPLSRGLWPSWVGFTEIVLALSGVEAIANMTGIMVPPVEKTARKAIVPVLVEIVLLNLILAAAMNALPDSVLLTPSGAAGPHRRHAQGDRRALRRPDLRDGQPRSSSPLLLLSAVNTALADLVSIQFMLSRDKELPHLFSGLNRFGMPVLPLLIAAVVPAMVVLLFPDVTALAGLYAIGVVGAIAINLGTTSTNRELALRGHERALMLTLTVVMIAIEGTICVVKPDARGFAMIVLVAGLAGRLATIVTNRLVPLTTGQRAGYVAIGRRGGRRRGHLDGPDRPHLDRLRAVGGGGPGRRLRQLPDPGYRVILLELKPEAVPGIAGEAVAAPARRLMLQPGAYKPKARIMVATQGNPRLLAFAIQECQTRQAELQLLFIRHLAVTPMGPTAIPTLAEDDAAQELFERVRQQALEAGVPLRLLYGVARDIPDAILDMAVTHGADLLLLGTTSAGRSGRR